MSADRLSAQDGDVLAYLGVAFDEAERNARRELAPEPLESVSYLWGLRSLRTTLRKPS
ncbi:hypothetical protein [Streptomyces microflavus]|uniref:hypothetical protein n=1 Tax=Streptomyces microflavus TaxID=1919 RepID=UPI003B20F968